MTGSPQTHERAPAEDQRTFVIYVCPICGRESGGNTGCLGSMENRHPASGFVPLKVVPKSQRDRAESLLWTVSEELGRALREGDEAREALKFYAQPRNHRGVGTSPVYTDRGRRARCALGDECGRCHGHGLVWNPATDREEFCPACHGGGYVRAAGSEEENHASA